MSLRPAVGPQANVQKYDILSAIMVQALAGTKHDQRRALRLMSLVTTRYNWRHDDLSIGHQEIAALWSVDTRTVKREMAAFKTRGWIAEKTRGVRGRVGRYRICFETILADTMPHWTRIGPDFEARAHDLMPAAARVALASEEGNVLRVDFSATAPDGAGDGPWPAIRAALKVADPQLFGNWFERLGFSEAGGWGSDPVGPIQVHGDLCVHALRDPHRLGRPSKSAAGAAVGPACLMGDVPQGGSAWKARKSGTSAMKVSK